MYIKIGSVKTFRRIVDTLAAIRDDCKLKITHEGIFSKMVDPANVALIHLNLPKQMFSGYEVEFDEVVGVDVTILQSILEGVDEDDENPVEIFIRWKDNEWYPIFVDTGYALPKMEMEIKTGIFQDTIDLLDPQTLHKDPVSLSLTLPATVQIKGWLLKMIIKRAEKTTDWIGLSVLRDIDPDNWFFQASTEFDDRKFKTRLLESRVGGVVGVTSSENVKSLYSLDYLNDIVDTMDDDDLVTLRMGDDHPLTILSDIGDYGSVNFMIAPRIESE